MTSFRTIAAQVRFEPERILGSRHIGTAVPVGGEDEIAVALQAVRDELPFAGHHAFAWRLGHNGQRFRYSDGGEPSGTAGKPVLQQIDRLSLTRTLVVVSRVFGGTKLGTGGLVRAYGGAAAAVLEHATVVERTVTATVAIEFDYGCAGAMQALLHAASIQPAGAEYGARTKLCCEVPVDELEAFVASVRNATASRADVQITLPEADN